MYPKEKGVVNILTPRQKTWSSWRKKTWSGWWSSTLPFSRLNRLTTLPSFQLEQGYGIDLKIKTSDSFILRLEVYHLTYLVPFQNTSVFSIDGQVYVEMIIISSIIMSRSSLRSRIKITPSVKFSFLLKMISGKNPAQVTECGH